jgi:hypothetical protein
MITVSTNRHVTLDERKRYADIVRRLASGENDPALDELLDVLAAVGKSASELARDVAACKRGVSN